MGVNSIVFYKRFPDEESCYNYLENKMGRGLRVQKCGHTNYCSGRKPYSRRCTTCCKYDESPTAGTMFDKCKFSLHLAFHIVFKLSTRKKGMSSPELSHEFDLRQMTCWEFKRKVQQAMRSSMRYPLTGTVHVDEFLIGEYEEGQTRRSSDSKKRLVVVALEVLEKAVSAGLMPRWWNTLQVRSSSPFSTTIFHHRRVLSLMSGEATCP